MKLPRRNFLHLAAGAAALPAVSRVAWTQAYPSRPVRIIVPAAPSGAFDIMARLIGQRLSKGRLIRCTVPGFTPNRLAMTRTPGLPGVARASRIGLSEPYRLRAPTLPR
jgi:hypothetical protein